MYDPDNIRGMSAGAVQRLDIPARYVWGMFGVVAVICLAFPVLVCAIVVICGG